MVLHICSWPRARARAQVVGWRGDQHAVRSSSGTGSTNVPGAVTWSEGALKSLRAASGCLWRRAAVSA
eukprot:13422850-Alexandrium_andersonii.AAC.1